jgi:snRNA-activating protein complex subunit 3
MSGSSTPGNETVTSSASVETQSSISPLDYMAIGLVEPHGNHGKKINEKRNDRERKENNGVLTSDSTAERETAGSPVDMAILPYEPQGSKGKPGGGKGKVRTISNSSTESRKPVSPSKDMPVIPHDPEGAGQTKGRKGKKRGRHFDREVRAHILQVCHSISFLCAF